MTPEHTDDPLRRLQAENQHLRQELDLLKASKEAKSNTLMRRLASTSSRFFLGRGLRDSLNQLYEELPDRVSKTTMADVTSYMFWRITRLGTFALMAAIVPIMILMVQTTILGIQNEKLDYQNQLILNQNRRLDQQVQLDEGNRRSSFIFMMSNIMDKLDEELKNPGNQQRQLSDELVGRIVALSQALMPYRYLENDQLTARPLSPERGQLLFALVNSMLDEATYEKIFQRSNFSFADLKQANLSGAFLNHIDLRNAHLPGAVLSDAKMAYAKLDRAYLRNAHLENTLLAGAQLEQADLRGAELVSVDLSDANLRQADLSRTRISGNFTNAQLDGLRIREAEIEFALLEGAHFQSREWLDRLDENRLRGFFSIQENYLLVPEEVIVSATQTDTLYKFRLREDSQLSLMGDCEHRIAAIVKSAPEVQALTRRVQRQGDQLILLTEANPFGAADLDIARDSVYIFRLTTEEADFMSVLMWVQFNPRSGALHELPLTSSQPIRPLSYPKTLHEQLPAYCRGRE